MIYNHYNLSKVQFVSFQPLAAGFLDHVTILVGIAVQGKAVGGVIHQPYYNYQVRPAGTTPGTRTLTSAAAPCCQCQLVMKPGALLFPSSFATGCSPVAT